VPFTDSRWITATEAAQILGEDVTSWHVLKLAESNAIGSIVLIDADSLDAYKEQQ
jgi:hypothetical protein